jgi:hypothetical protein
MLEARDLPHNHLSKCLQQHLDKVVEVSGVPPSRCAAHDMLFLFPVLPRYSKLMFIM